jgi:uncharacterized protein (TIGR00730 family)
MTMRRVCVFAGSREGASPTYAAAARELGRALVRNDIELVYGGASIGLMGVVAETVLDLNGKVIGVVPANVWKDEDNHRGISELHVVNGLHERKELMMTAADGFIALPGGLGTFDELFEVLASRALALHAKPIGLLDPLDYFGPFQAMLDRALADGFVGRAVRRQFIRESNPARLIGRLRRASRSSGRRTPEREPGPEIVAVVYSEMAAKRSPACPPPSRRRTPVSIVSR